MPVNFKSRISWPKNAQLLPAKHFGVSVPPGVDASNVRYPNFVDVAEMQRLEPDRVESASQKGGSAPEKLSIVEGLVTGKPTIVFADAAKQWRKSPLSTSAAQDHGPWKFEFTGGDVFLDLELGFYLLNSLRYDPKDHLSVQIFALVCEHELLHVLDDIDIAKRWLPPHLRSDQMVARFLDQGEPFVYGRPSDTDVEGKFAEFITKIITDRIYNVWVTEQNRREELRDAPDKYKIVQDKVDALRAKQINRPDPNRK
jgi:hypothetical protein